jgi:myo-inositol-1(or 4)-monophosphatase
LSSHGSSQRYQESTKNTTTRWINPISVGSFLFLTVKAKPSTLISIETQPTTIDVTLFNMEAFIKEIIQKAGETIMPFFGTAEVIHTKEKVTDVVTKADLASQEVLVSAIKKNYPDHGIISEESKDYNTNAEYVWYIDPLDGTKNFASRVPMFGINVALAYKGGIKYAAIFSPPTNELCYAETGKGTYLNGKKIECSSKQDWKGIYGVGQVGYGQKYAAFQEKLNQLSEGAWTNSIGCPALSAIWVADGRRHWYIGPSRNSWDYAAPWLVAKEAGCVASNMEGTEWNPGDKGLVLTTKFFQPELLRIIKETLL